MVPPPIVDTSRSAVRMMEGGGDGFDLLRMESGLSKTDDTDTDVDTTVDRPNDKHGLGESGGGTLPLHHRNHPRPHQPQPKPKPQPKPQHRHPTNHHPCPPQPNPVVPPPPPHDEHIYAATTNTKQPNNPLSPPFHGETEGGNGVMHKNSTI